MIFPKTLSGVQINVQDATGDRLLVGDSLNKEPVSIARLSCIRGLKSERSILPESVKTLLIKAKLAITSLRPYLTQAEVEDSTNLTEVFFES